MSRTTVTVKPNRAAPFFSRHPWVHRNSLLAIPDGVSRSESVDLVTHDGKWIARGLVNPASRLAVRLYSWDPAESIDDAFVADRIDRAIARRVPLGLSGPDDAVRLVYSEADGLSGLIVDRYGGYVVLQINAAVWLERLDGIVASLRDRLNPRGILLRIEGATGQIEGMDPREEVIDGEIPEEKIWVQQSGLSFGVALHGAQKTGLYLDQRENYLAAARYLAGRRVLDICCYAGGFGITGLVRGGASHVTAVDSSARAIESARENAARNGAAAFETVQADCFDYLKEAVSEERSYDAVILDPPRLAGNRRDIDAAMRAYHRLNRWAVQLLPPGGILVTCSCSGRVSRADFLNMLVDVGRKTHRDLVVMENRTAAPDHPMAISCPETDYLKCMICEVT